MDFETWIKECDKLVSNEFGLGLYDFEDWDWMSAFEDDFKPAEAVEFWKEDSGVFY